jgi:hypothetical protein
VAALVIDSDHFKFWIFLIEKKGKVFGEVDLFISSTHDNRNRWHVLMG